MFSDLGSRTAHHLARPFAEQHAPSASAALPAFEPFVVFMAFRPSEARRAEPGIASRPSCVSPALGLPSRGRASGDVSGSQPASPDQPHRHLGGEWLAGSLADEVAVLMSEAEAAIGARSDVLPEVKAAPRDARRMLHARAGECYTPERMYTPAPELVTWRKWEVVRQPAFRIIVPRPPA